MITLYHGSNVSIKEIDLSMGQRNKDFGKGFYLTDIRGQALAMAERKVALVSEKRDDGFRPIVTSFYFDDEVLKTDVLKVLWFESANAEWAEFIAKNRMASRTGFSHDYDMVYGPVANDGVFDQLRRYMRGMITADQLAKELQYTKLNNQYFFGTERSLKYLRRKE